MNLLGSVTRSIPKNGRNLSTNIGEIDLTRGVKVRDVRDTITRYTLIIANQESLTFENIVIKETNEGITSYILKYDANAEWLIKNAGNFKMANFTGFVSFLNLERELISKAVVNNGVGITIERGKTIKNGRVNCDGGDQVLVEVEVEAVVMALEMVVEQLAEVQDQVAVRAVEGQADQAVVALEAVLKVVVAKLEILVHGHLTEKHSILIVVIGEEAEELFLQK